MFKQRNIAVKSDSKLWNRSVSEACSEARLCKHSARKMQWATRRYKSLGGAYKGKRSRRNSMTKWTREKWDYVDKRDKNKPFKSRGRYLPKSVRRKLSTSEKKKTNRRKRNASRRGKRKASYGSRVKKLMRKRRRA